MDRLLLNGQLHIKGQVTKAIFPLSSVSAAELDVKLDFQMPQRATAYTATTQRVISAL